MQLFDKAFNCRYYVLIFFFVILFLFKINFSSISVWNNFVPNDNKALKIGKTRMIRSDEWGVNLTWQMSQLFNGFHSRNYMASDQGLNTIIAQYQAAWNIQNIGRPINWGFMLFGSSYGLSWYWVLKIILLFGSSLEFIYLITGDKAISLFWAFFIAYAPGVQWWASNYIPELITSAQVIICSLNYLLKTNKLMLKSLYGVLITIFAIGLLFIIYPPWQIPLMYFTIVFCGAMLCKYRLQKLDYMIGFMVGFILLAIFYNFYQFSKEDIDLTRHTVYPGSRFVISGSGSFQDLLSYIANILTPYRHPTYSNESELSGFWSLFPLFPFICYVIPQKDRGIYFNVILILNTFFIVFCLIHIEILDWIGKYNLFFMITPERLKVIIGLLNTYLMAMFLNKYKGDFKYCLMLVNCLLWVAIAVMASKFELSRYMHTWSIVAVILMWVMGQIFIMRRTYLCLLLLSILTVTTGVVVNPIVFGIKDLYGSHLSKVISEIRVGDPKAVWMSNISGWYGNYLLAQGVYSFNSVKFYPDFKQMYLLDPEHQYQDIYNRYARIDVSIVTTPTRFDLIYLDSIRIELNILDLFYKTKIKYILSSDGGLDKLDKHFTCFRKVDNFIIYKVKLDSGEIQK
jgi:hypothetical protein